MQNDDYDTNSSHYGKNEHHDSYDHGAHEPRGRGGSRRPNHTDNTQRSRDKQKTTAIALSVVTCLFMGVIGYEIIRENQTHEEEHVYHARESRPSLVVSKASLYDDHTTLAADEDYESYEIQRLKDQNRQQAAKIKALRSELVEKMQAMHEIKANLFKQEGDPKDKAKINELTQKIEEKEQSVNQMAATMKRLESEIAGLQKNMSHMEITRDALASMLESQRATKDQEIRLYQKQLADLEKNTGNDLSELQKKIALHEETQTQLSALLEEKTAAITHLEDELSNHKTQITLKAGELEALSSLFHVSKEQLKSDVLSLVAGLEWEMASKTDLEARLTAELEKQDREKSAVISLLEAELANRNEIIATHEKNLYEKSKSDAQEQVNNLIATLEWEIVQTSKLQTEIDQIVKQHQSSLSAKHEQIANLENALNEQKGIVDVRTGQLQGLIQELASLHDQREAQISSLIASHEVENAHNYLLSQQLADNYQRKAELENTLQSHDLTIQKYEKKLSELQSELDAKRSQLAEKQEELNSHKELGDTARAQLENQITQLSDELQSGRLRIHDLQIALEEKEALSQKHEALEQNHAALQQKLSELQSLVEKKRATLVEKQAELDTHKELDNDAKAALEAQINQLSDELQTARLRVHDLQNDLEENEALSHKHEALEQSHAALKQQLDELVPYAELQTRRLEELEQSQAELEEKLHAGQQAKKMARKLSKQLQDITSAHEELKASYEGMKNEVDEKTRLLAERELELEVFLGNQSELDASLREQIQSLNETLANESARYQQLEAELQQAYEYQKHYENSLSTIAELEHTTRSLENTITRQDTLLNDKEMQLKNTFARERELETTLRKQIHELTETLKNESAKYQALEKQLYEIADSHTDEKERADSMHQRLQEALNDAAQLDEKLKVYQESLAAKEAEIEKLIESKHELEDSLSNEIHALRGQIDHEQTRSEIFQNKYKEAANSISEERNQTRNLRAQIEVLSQSLIAKDSHIAQTEEHLNNVLPQIDALQEHKQRLEQSHEVVNEKLKIQQDKLGQLSQELNLQRDALKKALSDYETLKNQNQQLQVKSQRNALRASILEDELSMVKSEAEERAQRLVNVHEAEISQQSQLIQELSTYSSELEREKNEAQNTVEHLRSELNNLKVALEKTQREFKDQALYLNNEHAAQISLIQEELLNEKRKAEALENETRSLVDQYLQEQQRATDLRENLRKLISDTNKQPTARKKRRGNNMNDPADSTQQQDTRNNSQNEDSEG